MGLVQLEAHFRHRLLVVDGVATCPQETPSLLLLGELSAYFLYFAREEVPFLLAHFATVYLG
jgi:hypothetical protein